jgi:hypothetical protein
MTAYRCTACHEPVPSVAVRPGLDPRYGIAYCTTCRRSRWTEQERPEADGMAKVALSAGQGADAAWQASAGLVARRLAASGVPFTVEDITREVGLPSHRNAVGSLVNTLARAGIIEWTGEMRQAQRGSRHANLNRVWIGRRAA